MRVIPPARCIAGRELTEPRLSPDGTTVAFVASTPAGAAVQLVPVAGGPERQLTADPAPRAGRGLGGGCFDWLPDATGLVYAAADGALWQQPVADAAPPRRLTDPDPARPPMAPAASPDGSRVAFAVDLAEIHTVDLGTGERTRLDDAAFEFVNDPCWSPSGSVAWQAWSPPHMPWDESAVVTWAGSGSGGVSVEQVPLVQQQQPRFASDGVLLRVRDDTGMANVWRGAQPLWEEPFEHAGPTWGPGQRSFASSPDGKFVAFARNERGFGRLCVVAADGSGVVTEVARGVHGQLSWVGSSLAALRTGARTPTQVVAYDTATWARTPLAVGPLAGWEGAEALVEPEAVELVTDATVLHARLYRAPGTGARLICWVHGGPTDQWQVTFMPRLAHWISRGYSILVPDHRGSTGHGRAYTQALRGRWGELDVADTAALVRHVQERGGAAPESTVLFGSSAGGLTVLGVAARHPGLASCAVVAYPVSDLISLDEATHRFEAHYTSTLVGARPAADALYRERSPLSYADRLVDVPLLVLHGDADPVVPVEQSRALVERVLDAGGTATLHVYEGEGHGLRVRANQLDEYERVGAFVDRHLPVPSSRG